VSWSGRAFAFVGARGGAGASSSAAFAAASHATTPTGVAESNSAVVILCDLDEGHAGTDVALGLESAPGFRWQHFADLSEPPAPDLVIGGLPNVAGFDVLAWGDAPKHTWGVVPMALNAILGNYEGVVFDVGRSYVERCLKLFDDLGLDVCWVLVCPGDVTSVNAAARVRQSLAEPPHLLIRSDSQSGLRERQIVEALHIDQARVAAFTPDSKVHRALVRGEFGRLAATRPKAMSQVAKLIGAGLIGAGLSLAKKPLTFSART